METDHAPRPFYAWMFIIGVIAATLPRLPVRQRWCSALALAILVTIFVLGLFARQLSQALHVQWWHTALQSWQWGVIAAVVVLGLANGTDCLKGLAIFGTLSYGIYVFHFLAMLIVAGHGTNDQQTCFLVAIMTLPMAYLSWCYIEAPCIRLGQRLTRRARVVTTAA
jgi:peptidoglycan/LPS O-acetylase OafA/YrhL